MTNKITVESILTANDKGIGKTNSLPALYSLEGNIFEIKGIAKAVVSEQLIGAKFIQLFHSFIKDMEPAKKVQHVEALSKGFLTLDQLRGTTNEAKKGKAKDNITALEYRTNCIKLVVDSVEVITSLTYLTEVNLEKSTKLELVGLINELRGFLFNETQQAVYQVKVDKEIAEKERFKALEERGLTIVSSTAKEVTVTTSLSNMAVIPSLAGIGYALTASSIDALVGTVTLTLTVAEVAELA